MSATTRLAETEEYLQRAFDYQESELAAARKRFTEKARDGNRAAHVELDRIKAQQKSLAHRREQALLQARREVELIQPGRVEMLATALIQPSTDPDDIKARDIEVERIAVEVAIAFEAAQGADVRDVSTAPKARLAELLRVAGQLTGADSAAAAQAARLEVLKWAAQQIGDQLPDVAMEGRSFEHLRGGRICIAAGFADDHRALWALRVDRPDANVAQRTWTTEIVVGHVPGAASALFSLRLLASSPEATLQVEPAVPGLVRQIATACGLQQSGSPLDATAWHIASEDDAQQLVAALLDPARTVPYLVCSVAERETQPDINCQILAKVTLGIARVVVVPAAHTWVLTQNLGKPLSVFNGAVRAYMPGFTYDANPYAHRLFFLDPKPTEERSKSTLTALRWLAANESIRRLPLGAEVLAFSAVREASLDVERERLKQTGSADTEQLHAAQAQVDALKDDLRRSAETQQWLSDEHTSSFEFGWGSRRVPVEWHLKNAGNQIEDAVVQAKKDFAQQIAVASGMEYRILKSTDADKRHYRVLL